MCVIICIEDGKYPSKSTLEDAESLNSHGGSIAWLNKDGSKSYHKGIDASKIHNIIEKELRPNGIMTAIIHFRIASVGDVDKKLCHPFEITKRVDLNLYGKRIQTDLLFHNGTWGEYAETMLEYLGRQNKPVAVPYGKFSDTRVMAFLAYRLGHNKMSKLVKGWNKIAVLTSKGIVKYGSGWCDVKGNQCSNDYFVDKPWYNFNGFTYNKKGIVGDKEKEIVEDLKKKYNLTDGEIEDYLDYGYSVYDIEYFLEEDDKSFRKQLAMDDELNVVHDMYNRGDI